MTDTFNGFGRQDKQIIVPETFFSDLLPLIDDLAELKLTLFCMWALQQREGRYRFLMEADFAANETLMAGLCSIAPNADPQDTLKSALLSAVDRGTLLKCEVPRAAGGTLTLYLMNSERGREAVEAVQQGLFTVVDAEQVEILPPRPNIYRLYEQEIGALTPMIADELRDLQATHSEDWLRDAIRVAVREQALSIRYIASVLDRWRKKGKTTDEINGRHESVGDAGDGRRFITGKYADFIDH